ncbi:MAG: porin [Candidatus Dactylopiibacterium sp.]|nr:porin [Candidatus Dactylopiibacterium sp.]
MQKKLIALAVAGLMSGAAFAQTSVTLGGKFDACYEFSRGERGSSTKETQKDGCNSTSRVSIGARETIAKGYSIRVDYDIRFAGNNVHEGKTGLASNDKKAMAFTTPFGTLQWGVANLMSNDYKLAEKPYMVTPKDTELVKYGLSQQRETSLTNRSTSYWSPVLSIGPWQGLVKGTFAFGDNQKSGANDAAGVNAANVMVLGTEGKLFDGIADYGIDVTQRGATSSEGGASGGAFVYNHYYVNVRPIPGNKNLKLSAQYNTYKGWEGANGAATGAMTSFKEKNTNFVVSYNFNGKAEVGLGVSHMNEVGTNRNNGRGIMLGGSYFLSKSVQVYGGFAKNDVKTTTKVYRYDGTASGFNATRDYADGRVVKVGILKEF